MAGSPRSVPATEGGELSTWLCWYWERACNLLYLELISTHLVNLLYLDPDLRIFELFNVSSLLFHRSKCPKLTIGRRLSWLRQDFG